MRREPERFFIGGLEPSEKKRKVIKTAAAMAKTIASQMKANKKPPDPPRKPTAGPPTPGAPTKVQKKLKDKDAKSAFRQNVTP